MDAWVGQHVPKLGFGMMRLPMVSGTSDVDMAQIMKMVDAFLAGGFTYVDTAFGYMQGKSEEITREALVDRYPRDAFLLATKLPPWELKAKEDMERVFSTQLRRTNAGYFDYYLLHAMGRGNLQTVNELDAWGFLRQKKAEGLVRHIGFSFHDNAQTLDEILSAHPEIEFVQLQLNYVDWEDDKVQARLCYETARKHGKSVVIMEPVKGGALATLNPEARAALEAAKPGQSPASWAMRYAASLEGVITVLSGMSTLAQMEENIQTLTGFTSITDTERETIAKVNAILAATETTPCTDCKYCTEKCPQNIPIPEIIRTNNGYKLYGHADKGHYGFVTRGKGKASDCIACGVCEGRCPQHIEIIDVLKECAARFEQK